MNQELKNRLRSFSWRLGGMVVVALLAFIIDNALLLQIPSYMVVVLGLAMGEITKYLKNEAII